MKKQIMYKLAVPHKNRTIDAFLWWLRRRNARCKSFCPTCQFFFACQEDVALEELTNGKKH